MSTSYHYGRRLHQHRRYIYPGLAIIVVLLVVGAGMFIKHERHKPAPAVVATKPHATTPKSTVVPTPAPAPKPAPTILFSDPLNGPDRIVTNEFTYYSPGGGCPYTSSTWAMTSGTLFVKNGAGYSGVPTVENQAVCDSTTQTNSAVFRLNTKASSFTNVDVSMDYMAVRHIGAPGTSYDGIHMWVGYQSEYALYAASIFRWDGNLVIKKKVPVAQAQCSDPSNDGCYYDLTMETPHQSLTTVNIWRHADIIFQSATNGTVTITEKIDGQTILQGVDKSINGPAYTSGAVGVRGDNTEFYFKNFTVTKL